MTFIPSSVRLESGVMLQYVERGDRSGVPVVFLHGVTDSWRSFETVLPELPRSVRAFAVTLRGHGDSARPEAGYGPGDFAADLASFLDAVGVRAAVVVGHSMGSYVAQRFAIDYPGRVLGLVLVGSFASLRENEGVGDFSETVVSGLEDPIDPALALDFQLSTLARPISQRYLATVVGESLKVPARVWRAAFRGLVEGDHSSDLRRIRARTLVIWGDADAYFGREDQDALARAIEGSRLSVWRGAGHALHWEEPGRFAAEVAAFAIDTVLIGLDTAETVGVGCPGAGAGDAL